MNLIELIAGRRSTFKSYMRLLVYVCARSVIPPAESVFSLVVHACNPVQCGRRVYHSGFFARPIGLITTSTQSGEGNEGNFPSQISFRL